MCAKYLYRSLCEYCAGCLLGVRGDETDVPRKSGAGHLHCTSSESVNPRPPGAASGSYRREFGMHDARQPPEFTMHRPSPLIANSRCTPAPGVCDAEFAESISESLLIERELVCIQERQMRRAGPAWNREQALPHQLVGMHPTIRSPGRRTTTRSRGAALRAFRCNKVSKLCG
jgi:hypothetical protein